MGISSCKTEVTVFCKKEHRKNEVTVGIEFRISLKKKDMTMLFGQNVELHMKTRKKSFPTKSSILSYCFLSDDGRAANEFEESNEVDEHEPSAALVKRFEKQLEIFRLRDADSLLA